MTRPAFSIVGADDAPSAFDCIAAIVGAMGNLDLAGERIFGPKDPRDRAAPEPKALLIATIAEDPSAFDELQKQLRVLTLLDTFSKTQTLAHVVDGSLDKQEPATLAKLYVQMLSVLTTLTDDHTQNINSQSTSVNLNLSEQVLRGLPPEVREAVKMFQQRPQLPNAPNNAPALGQGSPSDPLPQKATPTDSTEIEPVLNWSGGDPPPNVAV